MCSHKKIIHTTNTSPNTITTPKHRHHSNIIFIASHHAHALEPSAPCQRTPVLTLAVGGGILEAATAQMIVSQMT